MSHSYTSKEEFQNTYTLSQRQNETSRKLAKSPHDITAFITRSKNSKLPNIKRNKFLIPGDIDAKSMSYILNDRIKLPDDQVIEFYTGGIQIDPTSNFFSIYQNFKDIDGYVYIEYREPFPEWDMTRMWKSFKESMFGG